ncbi:SCO6880 family protein [Pseudonocardia sp. RS010]|uniref:SCO6880 family protein n=1 Tax=Pseudonocardia sp. RS010 TaxID=3385979 RepID=UPI0039A306A2
MSTTTRDRETGAVGPRVYRGLNTKERSGWVLGLTPIQALTCLGLAAPVLLAMSAGRWSGAFTWLVLNGALAALVVVPIRGRSALRWLGDLLLFQLGVLLRWSPWQSRAAAGDPGPAHEPDLPGVLARLTFPDGPPFHHQGRVCLIHDTVEGRWGATARLTHNGVGMLSDAECERLAARLGTLLIALGHREVVDRLSLYVRTVPDDGTEYDVWRAAHEDPRSPELARAATDELDHTIGSVSVRTELFVTVSGSETALNRPAKAAGGGITGRAYGLYRVLDGIDDQLKALGVRTVSWLTSAGLAEAIRTGFNPAAAAGLTAAHLTHPDPGPDGEDGLPMAAAGPTLAPSPSARAYHHDGFSSVSYTVLMPEAGTVFGSLGPLLAVRTAGERRTLAIHYEVLSQRAAQRAVQRGRFRNNVMTDYKAAKGFTTTAVDARRAGGARAQESAVAAGHAMVRYTVAASVTVPAGWNLEDHAAKLENDASGRFRLLRLELAQDSAFVSAALPVGAGLPRMRGALS